MSKSLMCATIFIALPAVVFSRILGNCKDVYGCANCEGYFWCDELGECVRVWEQNCNETEWMDYMIGNNDI